MEWECLKNWAESAQRLRGYSDRDKKCFLTVNYQLQAILFANKKKFSLQIVAFWSVKLTFYLRVTNLNITCFDLKVSVL